MSSFPQIDPTHNKSGDARLIRVAVITVSDRAFQGSYEDESGPKVIGSFPIETFDVTITRIVPDEAAAISKEIVRCVDHDKVDFVVTIGGAGSSNRDVTPEATSAVIHREVPGISEVIRLANREAIPGMLLSRGISGIRHHTLIVNLPGHPDSAKLAIETILPSIPHCIKSLKQHRPTSNRSQHQHPNEKQKNGNQRSGNINSPKPSKSYDEDDEPNGNVR